MLGIITVVLKQNQSIIVPDTTDEGILWRQSLHVYGNKFPFAYWRSARPSY